MSEKKYNFVRFFSEHTQLVHDLLVEKILKFHTIRRIFIFRRVSKNFLKMISQQLVVEEFFNPERMLDGDYEGFENPLTPEITLVIMKNLRFRSYFFGRDIFRAYVEDFLYLMDRSVHNQRIEELSFLMPSDYMNSELYSLIEVKRYRSIDLLSITVHQTKVNRSVFLRHLFNSQEPLKGLVLGKELVSTLKESDLKLPGFLMLCFSVRLGDGDILSEILQNLKCERLSLTIHQYSETGDPVSITEEEWVEFFESKVVSGVCKNGKFQQLRFDINNSDMSSRISKSVFLELLKGNPRLKVVDTPVEISDPLDVLEISSSVVKSEYLEEIYFELTGDLNHQLSSNFSQFVRETDCEGSKKLIVIHMSYPTTEYLLPQTLKRFIEPIAKVVKSRKRKLREFGFEVCGDLFPSDFLSQEVKDAVGGGLLEMIQNDVGGVLDSLQVHVDLANHFIEEYINKYI